MNSKKPELYTHVNKRNIATIRSPLDEIMAVRKEEGEGLDRVEFANLSSDNPSKERDSRTKFGEERVICHARTGNVKVIP